MGARCGILLLGRSRPLLICAPHRVHLVIGAGVVPVSLAKVTLAIQPAQNPGFRRCRDINHAFAHFSSDIQVLMTAHGDRKIFLVEAVKASYDASVDVSIVSAIAEVE